MIEELTLKEKEFVKEYVASNENGTATVEKVYKKKGGYARLKAHRLIMKDNISQEIVKERETLKQALENQGINSKKIAKKIDVLLEAKQGKRPDYTAINNGINHAVKVRGDYAPDKNINLNADLLQVLVKFAHDKNDTNSGGV